MWCKIDGRYLLTLLDVMLNMPAQQLCTTTAATDCIPVFLPHLKIHRPDIRSPAIFMQLGTRTACLESYLDASECSCRACQWYAHRGWNVAEICLIIHP